MIKLYSANSSIAWVAHIALEESKLDYEVELLDFSKQQQASAEYVKVNAKARVPSLIVDQGVITETPAILTYLAQLAPTSPLGLPADPYEQAKINEFNLYLCSTVHVAHAHKMRGHRWTDDKTAQEVLTANVPNTMSVCADMIEQHYLGSPWVHGTSFSISDPYLYRMSTWMESDGVDTSRYPKICAHRDAMEKRDSVIAVKAFYS